MNANEETTSRGVPRHVDVNRPLRVVILGGSGQVGTVLARRFHADGHAVTILSRGGDAKGHIYWDGRTVGPWADALDGADVVINLAGYSVNCRYHAANRERILRSRVDSTRAIGAALRRVASPPAVWLQASTATIYAHTYDAPQDEAHGTIGGCEPDAPDTWRFSIDVATAWERAADECQVPDTRLVKLRSAMIMSPDVGGVFDTLLKLVRRGFGGHVGDGRQYMSWIHHEDFEQAVYWLIAHDRVDGAVNVASPHPLSNREFMRALRAAWGARIGLPTPRWLLELGTIVLRTESELVLKSRRVVPGRLLNGGFSFRHADWPAAAKDLCDAWRAIDHRVLF